MAQEESNAYILGTDSAELHRLGIQHQVWASEAQRGWGLAGFGKDQVLLDLGCGPGFCSRELAYITGSGGKVIAVDKSAHYIGHLRKMADIEQLNIEAMECAFDQLTLAPDSIDGIYSRWALAWVANPKKLLQKLLTALKPGGSIVVHEYYNWGTHRTEPNYPALDRAIAAAYKSFKDQPGDIDIGRRMPQIFDALGMRVKGIRLMCKLATPAEIAWQWPTSFYRIYFPKLVKLSLLTQKELDQALIDLDALEQNPLSTIFSPAMVEIIAHKET